MYGQGNGSGYWSDPVGPPRTVVECDTLKECSAALVAWRDRNGLGSGNMARDCGNVKRDGKVIARVSYNGRIWTPHDFGHPLKKEITDP